MPIARNRRSLSTAGREHLASELRAIAGSASALRRRSARLAVTFRPRRQGRDALPDRPIPIDDLLLLALSYRLCERPRRSPRWMAILGIYGAALDFPGTGRVAFRCEQAVDVADPRTPILTRPNFTAMRSAVVLDQAIRDAGDREPAPRPRLPRIYFGFAPDRPPALDPTALAAAEAAELTIDGLRAWPAELFRRDGRIALERRPEGVFASLAGMKGRPIRNPAFAVLRRHGLLPAGVGYAAWLATVSRATDAGRAIQDPRAEGTEAARLRRSISDYVLADPAREPRILGDLAEACHAMGLKIAEGPEGVDALAELLDNPWSRPVVPYAAGVQVVESAGPPGPATLTFSDGVAEVDLLDLGRDNVRFRPAWCSGSVR
jgi:hypothetical protein